MVYQVSRIVVGVVSNRRWVQEVIFASYFSVVLVSIPNYLFDINDEWLFDFERGTASELRNGRYKRLVEIQIEK